MRVNELSALSVTANFTLDGEVAIPSTVHYRVKDIETDVVLQDWTSVTPSYTTDDLGATTECAVTINVSGQIHDMKTGKDREQKALCISTDKGLSTEYNEELIYTVYRLNARS